MSTLATAPALRSVPGPRGVCRDGCGATVVWAVTAAGPGGRGGRAMPLDLVEDLAGNVAVRPLTVRRVLAQVMTKGEAPDRPLEFQAMPHFATCPRRQRRR